MRSEQFKVKKSERGVKLGTFIYEKMKDLSHREVKKLIEKKLVSINGSAGFSSGWQLKPGDQVSLKFNPLEIEKNDKVINKAFLKVLFEDEYLLVIDKPAFMDYDSLVRQVNHYLEKKNKRKKCPYLGQMHRLDKETSGIILFTKKKIANTLADQFRDRSIKKDYLALTQGAILKEQGVIRYKIEKKKMNDGKKVKISNSHQAKESLTSYQVLERYSNATLLKVRLGTGRTHQIRIHFSEIGHSLWGDKLYGKNHHDLSDDAFYLKANKKVKRQMLHAWQIEFTHPITSQKMKFEAPIPQDIQSFIDLLRESC